MKKLFALKPMLTAGQIICDKCKFKGRYTTGMDEYPAMTTIEYCKKGHWENSTEVEEGNDYWNDCKDYLPCS